MCCSPICWLPHRCAKTRRSDCVASSLVCILEPSAGKHSVLTIPLAASREVTMKRRLVGLLMLLSSSAMAQQSPPEIPYDSVANLLKLPPDMHLGEAAGV